MDVRRVTTFGMAVMVAMTLGSCAAEPAAEPAEGADPPTEGADSVGFHEAHEQMIRFVEKTADAVAKGRDLKVAPGSGDVSSCTDAEAAPTGEVYVSHEIRFALQPGDDVAKMMTAVTELWTSEGHEVDDDQIAAKQWPSIFATSDGFNYSFAVRRDKGEVRVGGSTPCFPEEEV